MARTLSRNIPFSREGRIQLRVEGYSHLFAVSLYCKLRSLVTGTLFFRSFDILTAADKFRKINLLNLVLRTVIASGYFFLHCFFDELVNPVCLESNFGNV